jgi:hypothetical protein
MKLLMTAVMFLGLGLYPRSYRGSYPLAAGKDGREVVSELEFRWASAQKDGRSAVVEPLLAYNFVNTDADGETYGKEKLLSNLKGGQWEHNEISDVKVTIYSSTAIATGVWAGKGVDGDGTKIDRKERWTDTWVNMPNGKWLCVASQQTETGKK